MSGLGWRQGMEVPPHCETWPHVTSTVVRLFPNSFRWLRWLRLRLQMLRLRLQKKGKRWRRLNEALLDLNRDIWLQSVLEVFPGLRVAIYSGGIAYSTSQRMSNIQPSDYMLRFLGPLLLYLLRHYMGNVNAFDYMHNLFAVIITAGLTVYDPVTQGATIYVPFRRLHKVRTMSCEEIGQDIDRPVSSVCVVEDINHTAEMMWTRAEE